MNDAGTNTNAAKVKVFVLDASCADLSDMCRIALLLLSVDPVAATRSLLLPRLRAVLRRLIVSRSW